MGQEVLELQHAGRKVCSQCDGKQQVGSRQVLRPQPEEAKLEKWAKQGEQGDIR